MSLRNLVTITLVGVGVAVSSCGGDNSGSSTNGPVGPSCSSTGDCAPPTPYCDTSAGHCVECVGDANCGNAGRGLCDPDSHTCVQCLGDADCGGGQPYCSSDHRCVECLSASNCGDATTTCDAATNRCVPTCTTDADCGNGFRNTPYCDTSRSICVRCLTDANCSGNNPYCVNNACVECTTNGNCSGDQPYCSPNNNCVECLSDANCAGNTCLPNFTCGG